MTEFSDFGIILEIIGFGLFLCSAKQLPDLRDDIVANIDEEALKIINKWRWAYLELSGHKAQVARVIAIGLIIVGLILQLGFFNNCQ